ncbi:MAG: hypothetical protein B7Z35_11480 [Hydrogenophilales bacterium 12-61-10]|nr:MAG: hypothetical protein B7Z35_11480 [Hydrogenophilales bacterium 12-61-10]OYY62638.1 MAG: hypothetical protein B7Y50_00040 [Hydrogenophilales bacterium 28-61-11]OYZ56482.1 MAG: hypothetical protein B7Y21_11440 [Hydrogenophilales bacterium 16-61-112]OZA45831.1 MAG: hypothetical protein B7X81_07760 [Hydrogenophilales bacterium 17-61-76]
MSAKYHFSSLALIAICSLQSAPLWAKESAVVVTSVKYEITLDDKLPAVREMLISALEARNYAVINQLNVQEGLASRGIEAHPLELVEFCNLTKAYTITRHVPDFEMFAPCRFALFETDGKTTVMVQRPAHVLSILAKNPKLSKEGKSSLEEFDHDLKAMLTELASGDF